MLSLGRGRWAVSKNGRRVHRHMRVRERSFFPYIKKTPSQHLGQVPWSENRGLGLSWQYNFHKSAKQKHTTNTTLPVCTCLTLSFSWNYENYKKERKIAKISCVQQQVKVVDTSLKIRPRRTGTSETKWRAWQHRAHVPVEGLFFRIFLVK